MSTSQIRTTWTVAFAHVANQASRVKVVYDPADPYAVHLHFPSPTGRSAIVWTFARDLLEQGLAQHRPDPVGLGDVTVGPAEADDYIEITLHPRRPEAVRLFARRDEATSFVAQIYRRVPDQHEDEWIDWSAWLTEVLGGAA
ncbi:SsgA family sporulation/cell division regulator [Nonomuraea typhae]|uniref:SsgA family sporulation/cell division regulator n=1 Tax=Nonomuraea typhae TaxID=2603600 RepID=UPI0012FBC307|nr:SsgA family sporulation/cell division regulator [Nonomuraea typhae]